MRQTICRYAPSVAVSLYGRALNITFTQPKTSPMCHYNT
jgi:hypothetical protein